MTCERLMSLIIARFSIASRWISAALMPRRSRR